MQKLVRLADSGTVKPCQCMNNEDVVSTTLRRMSLLNVSKLGTCASKFVWALLVLAMVAGNSSLDAAQWWERPVRKATLGINAVTFGGLPHYMNKDERDNYLLVDLAASDYAGMVMLYDFKKLTELNGFVVDTGMAIASCSVETLYGSDVSKIGSGFKGGAVSSAMNIAIPGPCFSGVYTSLMTTNGSWRSGVTATWKTNETAFVVYNDDGIGTDGFDFSTDGRFLYSNVYYDPVGGQDDKGWLAKWSYNSLTDTVNTNHLVRERMWDTGLRRLRNLSLHRVKNRELIYFGEGSIRRGETNSVCVLDVTDDEWRQYTLFETTNLFTSAVVNAKVSGEDTATPYLYICLDEGVIFVFGLSADGLSLTDEQPLKAFTTRELAELMGVIGIWQMRNFEVSRDGRYAFLMCHDWSLLHVIYTPPEPHVPLPEGFAGAWGAWSIENDEDFSYPESLSDLGAACRFAWRARDKFTRSVSLGCMPPSEKPLVISLGAFCYDGEVKGQLGEQVEMEEEYGVPVWNVRVREAEGAYAADVNGIPVSSSALPAYDAEKWIKCVYGDVPAWLSVADRADWLKRRSRSRIECFMTLVPRQYYASYKAAQIEDESLVAEEDKDKLLIRGFRVGAETGGFHKMNLRAPQDAVVNILSSSDLSKTNWSFGGIGALPKGRSTMGVSSEGKTCFMKLVGANPGADDSVDSDGDGISDVLEREVYGTDPHEADTGSVGMTDGERIFQFELSPRVADTDGDGYEDAEEIANGQNPVVFTPGAGTTIRYVYDDDDRLKCTYVGGNGAKSETKLSPAGNPLVITNKGAKK